MRPDRIARNPLRPRPRLVNGGQPKLGQGAARDEGSARVDGEREALMRVAAAASGANGLEDVIEPAAEAACEAMGAGSFSISRWDRELDVMTTLINVGDLVPHEERFPERESYPLSDYPAVARLLCSGAAYFTAVDDPDADPRAVELLHSLGKESDIGVPVVVDGEVWGEVWAATSPGEPRFHASDVRFMEAVAAQLAGVIARAELFSNVSRLAYEDPLTGLANRRAFEERLGSALSRWRQGQGQEPVTLMACDVDELKAINDSRGHHAGDRALRRVGEALVAAAAPFPSALVGRLSGDEFAVLLDGSPLSAVGEVAGAALRLLREDRDTPIALSCGAAAAAPGVDHPEALLRAADTAQYAAKRRGGGQLCTAEASSARQGTSGRRRSRRRSAAERLDATAARLLGLLDGDLVDGTTLDRLEAVVAGFAETLNAAAWAISFAEHGSSTIRSISTADDRDSRLRGIRVGLDDEVYRLSDYPLTAKLVKAGTGSFHVDRHDGDPDDPERALLAELGFSGVLGAALSDLDGMYLLELYSDGGTAELAAAELRVQLLARAAAVRSASAVEHTRRLEKRTRQLALTGTLGARLAGMVDEKQIVEAAVDELFAEFGFPICAIVRVTPSDQIEVVAGRGTVAERLLGTGWSQPAGLGLIGRALREREVVIVGDVAAEPDYRATAQTEDVRSELCAPLWAGEELWGAIDLEDPRPDAFDDDDDARLVRTVADQVSAALHSARLYEQLERAYLGTAEALGAALEAKDSYTASHSRSITQNAEAVGRALGMDDAALRTLRFGAAFHDIGKLAVPEAILNKRGALGPEERRRIDQHTVIGEQILAPVEFLADVRPIVRHGHERWDGDGYPDGLVGAEIPLGARIVFACDAYDAMTTDRPYRAALTEDEARRELARCSGCQFDPDVVEALLAVLDDHSPAEPAAAAS